ncbi:MAG TPA: hypothetical protein VMI54_13475 [Polyangiaceae bacterium]|nr:hypothetical protein [Polyangiaceae bacterium]
MSGPTPVDATDAAPKRTRVLPFARGGAVGAEARVWGAALPAGDGDAAAAAGAGFGAAAPAVAGWALGSGGAGERNPVRRRARRRDERRASDRERSVAALAGPEIRLRTAS